MRTQTNETTIAPTLNEAIEPVAQLLHSQVSYHELADVPVQETNVLEQLQANLQLLENTHARLQFLMREIRYLMKV